MKFGLQLIGMAETIYGLVLVLFIIFLPSGIYGSLRQLARRGPRRPPSIPGNEAAPAEPALERSRVHR